MFEPGCKRQIVTPFCFRSQSPSGSQAQTAPPGPQAPPGAAPNRYPAPPGMMSPDMQSQGPPSMGPGGAPVMGGPPHGGAAPPGPHQGGGNFYNNFYNQQEGMNMEGAAPEGEQSRSRKDERRSSEFTPLPSPTGENFQSFPDDAGTFSSAPGGPDTSANGASAGQGGISVPDFLPPTQRVLFMRIQQKQQEEERARRMAEGGAERSKDLEGTKKQKTAHRDDPLN